MNIDSRNDDEKYDFVSISVVDESAADFIEARKRFLIAF